MKTLKDIMTAHRSDKATHHNYMPLYERLLEPVRDTATHVLELGIENGCSLRAFREYFTKAEIFGLEKEPHLLFREDRITTVHCNTTERDKMIEMAKYLPMFDVIVDDGSHVITEQLFALCVLWQRLKPGGIYVVEDIYKPEYMDLFRCFPMPHLYDLRVPGGCADDLVAVFIKPLDAGQKPS